MKSRWRYSIGIFVWGITVSMGWAGGSVTVGFDQSPLCAQSGAKGTGWACHSHGDGVYDVTSYSWTLSGATLTGSGGGECVTFEYPIDSAGSINVSASVSVGWANGNLSGTESPSGSGSAEVVAPNGPCEVCENGVINNKPPGPLEGEPCKDCDGNGNVVYKQDGTSLSACKECQGGGEVNKSDSTACDAGGGCGCCKEGGCWVPDTQCDCDPSGNTTPTFAESGPCSCDGQLGCVEPANPQNGGVIPMPQVSICFNSCAWAPCIKSYEMTYTYGICPPQGFPVIMTSEDDSISQENYCDIFEELNSLSQGTAYFFQSCQNAHEDKHVEQLKESWQSIWPAIESAVEAISIPFHCDTADSVDDVSVEIAMSIGSIILQGWNEFKVDWKSASQESAAYTAQNSCMKDMAEKLMERAAANNWPACN